MIDTIIETILVPTDMYVDTVLHTARYSSIVYTSYQWLLVVENMRGNTVYREITRIVISKLF